MKLLMTVPFAFIILIIFEYILWLLILLSNELQMRSPNTGFTRRLYSVHAACPQRTHGALKDPTALPQHPHNALSNSHSVFMCSVSTALLASIKHAPRRFATFFYAVETLWRCHSGVTGVLYKWWNPLIRSVCHFTNYYQQPKLKKYSIYI